MPLARKERGTRFQSHRRFVEEQDPGCGIGDLRGWLTTVVGRISLDMLRARKARREDYPGSGLPEPLAQDSAGDGPEHQAVLVSATPIRQYRIAPRLKRAAALTART